MTLCLFNQKQFYELLVSSQNITDKLNNLRISCLKNDVEYVYSTINVIYDVLLSAHQIPFTKYNALQTVLYILQTSSTIAIELIEIYILTILTDIALHYAHKRTEKDLEDYFIERGFRNSSGIRKLGKSFVQLAIQIVFSASQIKIFQTLLYTQTEISSKFKIAADTLIKKGLKFEEFNSSFDTTVIRNKYLKNIKQFQHETLGKFLTKKLKQQIVFSQGVNRFFKKIIQSDNCFITVTLINTCVEMLSNISHQFPHKKHYLSLFNFFIKQGNIYAIIIAHNSLFIRQFFEQIIKVNGESSLSYGKMIFPDVIGTLQQKFQFYCQFLRCLQIWSCCLPKNQIGQVSELKQMFDFLKNKRNFLFPQNLMLQKIVDQYQHNIRKKQRKNQHLLRYIEHDKVIFSQLGNLKQNIDTTFLREVSKSYSRSKEKKLKNQKGSNIFEKSKSKVQKQKVKDSTISLNNIQNFIDKKRERGQIQGSQKQSNKSFAQLFDQVNYCLMQVKQGRKLKKNVNHLKTFQYQWQNLKVSYKDELSQHKILHGDELADKIDQIGNLYQQLYEDKLTRQTFIHQVLQVLHPPQFKLMQKIKSQKIFESKETNYNENKILTKRINLSQSQYFGHPTPITHIVLEQNKNDNQELNNQENGNEVSIVNRNQNSFKKQQPFNSGILSPQYTISQDLNKSQDIKMKNNIPRRSAPFQITKMNSQQMGLSQNQKTTPNKFTNTEASTQKLMQIGKDKCYNRQSYKIFKSRGSLSQNSIQQSMKNSRFTNSRKIKGFQLSKCALQKLIYTVTSKSIKAYSKSVSLSFKKRNSLAEKKQKNELSNSKTIIKRQYQYLRMKSKQQSQRKLYLSGSSSQKHNLYYSDRQYVSSSLLTQKVKERQSNLTKQTSFQFINDRFSYYFPQIKSNQNTKGYLKNKGILFESPQLQIGFVHYRKELILDFTLYITAKVNISSIHFSVESDSNMQAYVDVNNISSISLGKQQTIKISTILLDVPYFLPSLLIKLKKQTQKQQSLIRIILPCTFNKYVNFNNLTNDRSQNLSSQYQNSVNFKTLNFKISKKLYNNDSISKYLSFFTTIKSSQHKYLNYQTECLFQNQNYLIELIQEEKYNWYLTGFSINQHSKPIQFLLHTLLFLLRE